MMFRKKRYLSRSVKTQVRLNHPKYNLLGYPTQLTGLDSDQLSEMIFILGLGVNICITEFGFS